MTEPQEHNGTNTKCMQSGINFNKRGKRGEKPFEVQPFIVINQNTESFLKSQREVLVKVKEEIESKILILDTKIAKLAKTSLEESSNIPQEVNAIEINQTGVSMGRPPSPPMHWSTLQVLNQFF